MRTAEWVFLDAEHPVYQRPPEDRAWIDPLPGMVPSEYRLDPAGNVVEPLRMETAGYPSVDIHQSPNGATVQQVSLRSDQYAQDADMEELEQLGRSWLAALKELCLGPYSRRDLRAMQHPYGYGRPGARVGGQYIPAEPVSWARLKRPRRIPSMRAGVPDRSFINLDPDEGGALRDSLSFRLLRWFGGVNLLFVAPVRYAIYLAHGTVKMQAHGPWETVARLFTGAVHEAWRRATYRAWRRKQDELRREVQALEGQFGAEALAQQAAEFEAGGFS